MVTWMSVCMYKHAHPGNLCSEIASEAILGQKQCGSSYVGLQSITSKFWLSIYAFAKPANIEFT